MFRLFFHLDLVPFPTLPGTAAQRDPVPSWQVWRGGLHRARCVQPEKVERGLRERERESNGRNQKDEKGIGFLKWNGE